jgi:hypothetical protein
VAVEVEQRVKALHERDGTAVRVGDAARACSPTLPGEHLAQEYADDLAQQVAVAGEQKPHLARYRQYPRGGGGLLAQAARWSRCGWLSGRS